MRKWVIIITACSFNGLTYAHGAEFVAPDGCNECECAGGTVSCTTDICTPCKYSQKLVK